MTTSIEWTDVTWNPITGCTKVSPGCKNCYAERIADRFFAKQYPPNLDGSPRKFTDVRLHKERLGEPLHWKRPRRVFVNSMSDLFHESIAGGTIGYIFGIMAMCPEHTFQILTKRAERMQHVMSQSCGREHVQRFMQNELMELMPSGRSFPRVIEQWPLPNVWLGISVENQKYADERIPLLLQTPAAVRFLSVEPMLEAVDLDRAVSRPGGVSFNGGVQWPGINWVICGGESGPGARPFNLTWAEFLLGQCEAAGVPFFMKQIGSAALADKCYPGWSPLFHDNRGERPTGEFGRTLGSRKGGDPAEWPEHLRVREFPATKREIPT
jgi:protein gp37